MTGMLALLVAQGGSSGGGGGGGATPLSASASGSLFYGSSAGAGTATTTTCTITASGGTAPYHYAWTRTAGDTGTTISSATASAVHWSRVYSSSLARVDNSFWRCVVTDSASHAITLSGIQAEMECIH